jgi:hypothetical protein
MSDTPSVETQLAVINTKLDTLIATQTDHEPRLRRLEMLVESETERTKRDDAIARLERFRWLLMGASIASGGAAAGIARLVLGG